MLLMILTKKKLLEFFTKLNYERQITKSLGMKKQLREKAISYMLNRMDAKIPLIVGLIKKT